MDESTIDEDNRRAFELEDVVAAYSSARDLMPAERHMFDRHLESGMAILDVGVGGGRTTTHLSQVAGRYVAVDYSGNMVRRSRERFPNEEFLVADAADLSMIADRTFDAVVFSFNGLDCLHPDRRRHCFLSEARRVLRPGGRLILSRHNARALFIVPLKDGPGLRALARRAKYALTENANRLRTIPVSRAFRKGEGYIKDRSLGMVLHAATCRRVVEETSSHGFDLIEVVGSNYPRRLGTLLTPWWYYSFSRR